MSRKSNTFWRKIKCVYDTLVGLIVVLVVFVFVALPIFIDLASNPGKYCESNTKTEAPPDEK